MKTKHILALLAPALLSGCSMSAGVMDYAGFPEGGETHATAVVGQRNVAGVEIQGAGGGAIGAGFWYTKQKPDPAAQ